MEGYRLVSKYKKSIECVTNMLSFSTYMAYEDMKDIFRDIYNLMDLYSSTSVASCYADACKIVVGLMKRFPEDYVFTDLREDNVLIRFSGDVIVSERYSELSSQVQQLGKKEVNGRRPMWTFSRSRIDKKKSINKFLFRNGGKVGFLKRGQLVAWD